MLEKLKAKLNGDMHLKEILTGSAITFVLKMSGMLLGYVVVLIISRKYGAEGMGVYSLTLSIMTFVAMIAAMGMHVSILRYVGQFNKSGEEHKLKLLYRYAVELVVPFSLLLAVVFYFSAGFIAKSWFHNPVYETALKFAAFIVPFLALQNISVEFIRGLKMLKISEFLRSVSLPIINIILLMIVGLFVLDKLLPLYTLGVGIMLSALFAVSFIVKKLQVIKLKEYNEFSKKELLSTSMPMMATTVLLFVLGNVSLFMLEIFSTTKNVGIFSVVFKIATLISLVLVVVNTMSAPKFSELYWAKKYTELQSVINYSITIIFFSSLAIAIVLIIFRQSILTIFGEEFITGSFALTLLIFGQVINAATGPVGVFLNMTGHQSFLYKVTFVIVIFSIIGNFIAVPLYGLNGAAFVTMISTVLYTAIPAIYVKVKLGYRTYYSPRMIGE